MGHLRSVCKQGTGYNVRTGEDDVGVGGTRAGGMADRAGFAPLSYARADIRSGETSSAAGGARN